MEKSPSCDFQVGKLGFPPLPVLSVAEIELAPIVPGWVMPTTYRIANGLEHDRAVNGIGFTATGDILLYRWITPTDWEKFPDLIGIKEVWIELEIAE